MKRLFFLTLILGAAFTSCKRNGIGELEMNFQIVNSGSNSTIPGSYVHGSDSYQVEVFQFYLGNIILIDRKDNEVILSDIELIKFDANGFGSIVKEIDGGKYKTLKFGLGVPQELNSADPANYSTEGHPLNTVENTYWGWANMYRFISIEGRVDLGADGSFDQTFAYHPGFEESYQELTYEIDLDVFKGETSSLNFTIELSDILHMAGSEIDVIGRPMFHGSSSDMDLSITIAENTANALILE